MTSNLSPTKAIRGFAFRQTLRGALILGFLVGIMMGAQGAAYAAAYPDQHSRDLFVASLKSVPAIGFMAGEIQDASTPASYSIYKSIALTTLIVSIWGLLVTTRLFRAQEEDGRMEMVLAGRITKAQASLHMLVGYGYSFVIAFLLSWIFITLLGLDSKVNLGVGPAGLLTLGVFLPGLFFSAVGMLSSQLALTRGRAVAYGLAPLLIFFSIRGAANSVSSWNDLKQFSPFGWTDLLNPVLDANVAWIIPTIVFTLIAIPLALYFARTRDLGASIIAQSEFARSDFFLLGSDFALALRQSIGTFVWWTLGTLAYTGLLASIAKVGADALSSSPEFTKVIGKLGGSYDDLVIAFLGFGGLFTALILLVMAAVVMSSVRGQESKGYLDNLLVQPVRRTAWLAKRLGIMTSMAAIISLLSAYMIWVIASAQNVSLDLGIMFQNAIALTGTIFLLIGIGAFFYGVLPRFASISMFVVIIWAFIVDVLKSFFSLGDFIDKTSLLHYVSFAPTKAPDWSTFVCLVLIGIITAGLGIFAFAKRDIMTE